MNNVKKVDSNSYSVEKGKAAKAKIEISKGEQRLKIVLEENAKLEFIASTSENSSLSLDFELNGENASVEVITCSKAKKTEQQKIKTSVYHLASNTKSIVKSRGASWDKGVIDLKGLARVEKNASGSKSYVECKAILLGEKSKARADPVLEILNNDVECSHAAAIKEIDKKQIFYLQTRGINEKEAKQLIVDAFLGEDLN
jgi:Fe-S cluster assembly protein SufB